MNQAAEDTVVRMRDFRARLRDQAASAAQTADDFVRRSPWRAAGLVALIALASGVVAAQLSARRAARD